MLQCEVPDRRVNCHHSLQQEHDLFRTGDRLENTEARARTHAGTCDLWAFEGGGLQTSWRDLPGFNLCIIPFPKSR